MSRLASSEGESEPPTARDAQKEHEFVRLSRWWVLETGEVYREEQDGDESENEESYEEETKSTKLPFLVLHPYSKYRIAWDLMIMLLLVENFIMVPFVLCFEESQADKSWSTSNNVATYFHFASDCTFMVDIILNFFTSYPKIDEKGEEVMVTHRRKIAWQYFRTWFFLDLLGSVPIEFILRNMGLLNSEGSSLTRFLKFFKLMRLIKLARIWRFERFIRKLREAFDFNPAIIRAVKMAAFFCLLAHALSCLLFWIGIGWTDDFMTCANETHVQLLADSNPPEVCFCNVSEGYPNDPYKQCSSETWVTENFFMVPHEGSKAVIDLRIGDQYLITLYWIMSTMTTVGFGDLKPVTQFEIWTCILAQILGATTFGFIVGNMAALAELLRGRAGAFKERMEHMHRFLAHCNIPNEVQRRVMGDLRHQMLRPVAMIKKNIIDKVPTALGVDLAKSAYQEVLEVCPLFEGISATSRSNLYLRLRPLHVAPGDFVVRKGDLSSSIIFLLKGGLHVVSDDDFGKKDAPQKRKWSERLTSRRSLASLFGQEPQPPEDDTSSKGILATLFPGNFIGEQCLLPGQDKFAFCVRSMEWSDLLYLDLRDIVKDINSEEEMLYVRLAARFRNQRVNALVEASQRLHQTSAGGKVASPQSAGIGAGALLQFGIPRMSSLGEKRTSSHVHPVRSDEEGQELIRRVEDLDMDEDKKELLLKPLAERTQSQAASAPRWAELLSRNTVKEELRMLQLMHGSLGVAHKAVASDMTETILRLDALGTRDEEGKPSQDKIEDRLYAILRRLQVLESKSAQQLGRVQAQQRAAATEAQAADDSRGGEAAAAGEHKGAGAEEGPGPADGKYNAHAAHAAAHVPLVPVTTEGADDDPDAIDVGPTALGDLMHASSTPSGMPSARRAA